jgi:hypothetical protein
MTAVGIAQRAPLADRADDLYETPPEATLALLRAERLPHWLWEPACGRGAIVRILRAAGHDVVATDLVNYGEAITPPGYYGVDFLMEHKAPARCEAIITNPPFKLANEFVAHALDLCPRVIMLLRYAFYEAGTGKQRKHLLRKRVLDEIPPARIYVFRNRLPMMHRDGWDGAKLERGAQAFAWFVWDRAHTGPTELHRISWRAS